jgi:hypothetical protein
LPIAARFLSVDPVVAKSGRSQDWNRYSYVANNPLRLIDKDGRLKLDAIGYYLSEYQAHAIVTHHTDPNKGYFLAGVYLFADDNTKIEARSAIPINETDITTGKITNEEKKLIVDYRPNKTNPMATNCHGLTFTKGRYLINNDQAALILQHDNYERVDRGSAKPGDVMAFVVSGEYVHTGKVASVDENGNVVSIVHLSGADTIDDIKVTSPPGATSPLWEGTAHVEIYRRTEPEQ